MDAIMTLHSKVLQKQRDELAKRVVANSTEHEADAPHIRSNMHTIYSQLAQFANIDVPDSSSVLWSNEQLTRWLREDFVRGFTREVVESYQAAQAP